MSSNNISMFGSVLQNFWIVVFPFVISAEEIWERRFKDTLALTVGEWTEEHILQTIQTNFLIHQVGKSLANNVVGATYWFRGPLLARWERIVRFRSEKNMLSNGRRRAPENFASLFEPLQKLVNSEIAPYLKHVKSTLSKGRPEKPKKQELQFIDFWKHLCDGAAQQIVSVSFALCLGMYQLHTKTMVRWSCDSAWNVCCVYLVDGIFLNSATCVLDCTKRLEQRGKRCCTNIHCSQRTHTWLLLLLKNGTELRALNVDVTSIILGRFDTKHFGNIPIHSGFQPYIWRGAELFCDPIPFIERSGSYAEFDRELWKVLDQSYTHLNNADVEKLRSSGESCYIVSGRHRIRHFGLCFTDFMSSYGMLPGEIQKLDFPTKVEHGEDVINRVRRESAYIDYINKQGDEITLMTKYQQALINAIAISQISEAFEQSCAVYQ